MKKIAVGFVLILLGMGIVTASSFVSLTSNRSSPEEYEDGSKEEVSEQIKEEVEEEKEIPDKDKSKIIKATIDVNPRKLNCKSKGKWITVYIGLPYPYEVEQININSILLIIDSEQVETSEEFPHSIVDIDGDDVPELMVKFSRSELIEILETMQFNEIEIIITGELHNNKKFKGGDVIELLH